MGVPKADAELKLFKKLGRGAVTSSFLYHYARLIEILASLETIERYMEDPELSSEDLRADAGINSLRGVGASEAPRGTLFHDYTVDRNGLLKQVNLIVATGQNNLAMNRTVAQMDQVTHTAAAQAEEISSTAESLTSQARQLQELVGRFTLDGGSGVPVSPRAAVPSEKPWTPPPAPAARTAGRRAEPVLAGTRVGAGPDEEEF